MVSYLFPFILGLEQSVRKSIEKFSLLNKFCIKISEIINQRKVFDQLFENINFFIVVGTVGPRFMLFLHGLQHWNLCYHEHENEITRKISVKFPLE